MTLTKQQKEKYLSTIRGDPECTDAENAWNELAWDHYKKLQLALTHICDYKILDALNGDAIDGQPATAAYLAHYDSHMLHRIQTGINNAYQGLQYLRELVAAESIEQSQIKRIK